jgi:hypothetical protein
MFAMDPNATRWFVGMAFRCIWIYWLVTVLDLMMLSFLLLIFFTNVAMLSIMFRYPINDSKLLFVVGLMIDSSSIHTAIFDICFIT